MAVKVRPYPGRPGKWQVDIQTKLANGEKIRRRLTSPCSSKTASRDWGVEMELHIRMEARNGKEEADLDAGLRRKVPTLSEFFERFIREHCEAEQQTPSTIESHRCCWRAHIKPLLGGARLDEVTSADVQRLKARLKSRSPKTVNNYLSTLSMMLKKADEWGVIKEMPCTWRQLRSQTNEQDFLEVDHYVDLVEGGYKVGPDVGLIVQLAGDAGLRLGEINALQWDKVNFRRGYLLVERAFSRNVLMDKTKGVRSRAVKLSPELLAALEAFKRQRAAEVEADEEKRGGRRASPFVFSYRDGRHYKKDAVRRRIKWAERAAKLEETGRCHVLRHTFCSHLAAAGVPLKAIQMLAGHRHAATTEKYMHLSPHQADRGIELLIEGRQSELRLLRGGADEDDEERGAG